VHAPTPEQAPVQPAKRDPGAGSAVSWTIVPRLKLPSQSVPHEMPEGWEVTVPWPLPDLLTLTA
jgi:hypothetical protein